MVKVQTKEFIFHYKMVDFTFLRVKLGDLALNQVNFVVHLILQPLETVSGLLDIHAHFYGNQGKLIKFFGLVFPLTNRYQPLLNPGLKLDHQPTLHPKLQVKLKKQIFSLPTLPSLRSLEFLPLIQQPFSISWTPIVADHDYIKSKSTGLQIVRLFMYFLMCLCN